LITTGNARPIPQPIPHRDTASLASSFGTLPIPTLTVRSVPALTCFGVTKIFRKANTPPLVKMRNVEFTFVPKIQAMCLGIPLCTVFCHLDAIARRASSPCTPALSAATAFGVESLVTEEGQFGRRGLLHLSRILTRRPALLPIYQSAESSQDNETMTRPMHQEGQRGQDGLPWPFSSWVQIEPSTWPPNLIRIMYHRDPTNETRKSHGSGKRAEWRKAP
jgi:hypothetical protein